MSAPAVLATSPSLAMVASRTLWFVTRGAGVVTLLLLTASVVLGVATSFDFGTRRVPKMVTSALHRNVSMLALAMLLVHIVTIVVDGYIKVGWLDVLVPFTGSYHRWALGLGVLASDVLIAIGLTSALRSRIPYKLWRGVHWLAYACWPVALWHGLLIGTDRGTLWLRAIDVACVTVGVGAVLARLFQRARRVEGRLVERPLARRTLPVRTSSTGRTV